MKLLPSPDLTTLIIRVRYYGNHLYLASVPNQGVYRSAQAKQGFERAAEVLLERHFPGQAATPVQIPHNDARVQALELKVDRNDRDAKEIRWFAAAVEIAD